MAKHTPGTLYPAGTRYSNSDYYDEATGEIIDGFQVFMQHAPDGKPTGRKSFIDNAGNLCGIEIAEQKRAEAIYRAAPELLEAIQELADAATALERAYVTQWGENEYTFKAHNAGAKARAVITKAIGTKQPRGM